MPLILAIKSNAIPSDWSDLKQCTANEIGAAIPVSALVLADRAALEIDPRHRQVVPYTVVRVADGRVVSYQRSRQGGEGRLCGKRSIGWGGHVELSDVHVHDGEISLIWSADNANARELQEECNNCASGTIDGDIAGVLVASETDVDKVHIGIVYESEFGFSVEMFMNTRPPNADPSIINIQFKTVDELFRDIAQYEHWSQILIRAMRPEIQDGDRVLYHGREFTALQTVDRDSKARETPTPTLSLIGSDGVMWPGVNPGGVSLVARAGATLAAGAVSA